MNNTARLATVLGMGAVLAATLSPLTASAAVPRNQNYTADYLFAVTANGTTYQHSYTVTPNPCGPDFTGVGQYPPAPAAPVYDETFSGTVSADGTSLSFTDTYFDPTTGTPTGYSYTFTGTFTDAAGDIAGTITDSNGGTYPATGTVLGESLTSSYRNHGAVVSGPSTGSRSTAAHSCLGMPAQSHG